LYFEELPAKSEYIPYTNLDESFVADSSILSQNVSFINHHLTSYSDKKPVQPNIVPTMKRNKINKPQSNFNPITGTPIRSNITAETPNSTHKILKLGQSLERKYRIQRKRSYLYN
jgi:hypothetical protein